MPYDKKQILELSTNEKRSLAFELLESIDEEFTQSPLPDWKKKIIIERLAADKTLPENADAWSEVRKKYFADEL